MSKPFNDTTNYNGLVQLYEKELGFDRGYVSGNDDRLKEFTADCNLSLDDFKVIELTADGTWQSDDSNYTDFDIIKTNIVSGQADYTWTTDDNGAYILEVLHVRIADASGNFRDIDPVDASNHLSFSNTTSGAPTRYDKRGNALILDPVPDYNYTNGIEMYISRENQYFATTDTTKRAGIPGLFHKYLYLKPAYEFASREGHRNLAVIQDKILRLENDIREYYSFRNGDVRKRLQVTNHSNK